MNSLVKFVLFLGWTFAAWGCATPLAEMQPTRVEHSVSFSGSYVFPAEAEEKPRPRYAPPGIHPQHWMIRGVEGMAVVAFVVDATGAPTQVQCRSASDAAFAEAAIDAVKQWRFSPAKKGGQPVACAMDATLGFKLRGRE